MNKTNKDSSDYNPNVKTLSELLVYAASNSEMGLDFISPSGERKYYKYSDFLRQAEVYAGGLNENDADNVIIFCIDNPESFIVTFWASIISNRIIVPFEPIRSSEIDSGDYSRFKNICVQHKKCTIVTDDANAIYYSRMIDICKLKHVRVISVSELKNGKPVKPLSQNEDDCIIIQYSSGSTGNPKGVILNHKNILVDMKSFSQAFEFSDETTLAVWSPLFHNMGLFVNISVMFTGGRTLIGHPAFTIQNPTKFFQILADERVYMTISNNFGLDWFTNKVDTSGFNSESFTALKAICVGSEVISTVTLNRFTKKFSKFGFSDLAFKPAYGLTECVLCVSSTKMNEHYAVTYNEGGAKLVGCGRILRGFDVKIVGKDGNEKPEGEIGEILIFSDAVTSGYFSGGNEEAFKDGGFRTGDLGFFKDGILYISGREKDMLIVRGHNYMINDLEHELIEKCGADPSEFVLGYYYNEKEQSEKLIVFSTVSQRNEYLEKLNEAFGGMLSKYGFTVEKIVFIEKIIKTSTGKVDRNGLVQVYKDKMYLSCIDVSSLKAKKQNKLVGHGSDSIQTVVSEIWADVLNMDVSEIDCDTPYYSCGMNSVKQYQMMNHINEVLGTQIKPAFFREFNTINSIAEGIADFSAKNDIPESHSDAGGKDIAITGISFRLPGADNLDQLWDILENGKNMISKVSDKRKKLTGISDWDNYMGEIKDIDMFDAAFFEVPEAEAVFTDPQERLILTTVYEALENAAEAFITSDPRNIGVYVSAGSQQYLTRIYDYINKNGIEGIPQTTLVNNLVNASAAKVTHFFNFSGPAMAIDSACSSFLTSLNTASKAIRNGEINGAIVSSSHFAMGKEEFMLSIHAGFLSTSGVSKVFDKDADGAVMGEGVISVFIEPISEARRKRKHIYSVIKGCAINNDGYALSLMAPSSDGQYKVLKSAYADAGMNPSEISYIETHGTGTAIGDPIEIHALAKLFADKNNCGNHSVGIGSVKSNIGHLLPAASGASIAKIIDCFEKKKLAASINVNNINPALKINKTLFYVVDKTVDWDVDEGRKRSVGITALGLGGTNAHIILQEADNIVSETRSRYYPLVVSAKSEKALGRKIEQLKKTAADHPELAEDIFYTLCCGRMSYKYRASALIDIQNQEGCFESIEYSEFKKLKGAKVDIIIEAESAEEFETKKAESKILVEFIENIGSVYINGNKLTLNDWNTCTADQYLNNGTDSADKSRNVKLCFGKKDADVNCSNISDDNRKNIISVLLKLYKCGVDIRWDKLSEFAESNIIPLPAYPFEYKSYWI